MDFESRAHWLLGPPANLWKCGRMRSVCVCVGAFFFGQIQCSQKRCREEILRRNHKERKFRDNSRQKGSRAGVCPPSHHLTVFPRLMIVPSSGAVWIQSLANKARVCFVLCECKTTRAHVSHSHWFCVCVPVSEKNVTVLSTIKFMRMRDHLGRGWGQHAQHVQW